MRMEAAVTIDKFVRSRRRSLAIEINDTGQLIVRAPMRLSQRKINKFILEKKQWILEKQQLVLNKPKVKKSPIKFEHGVKFPFLGDLYPLNISEHSADELLFKQEDGFCLPNRHIQYAEVLFKNWYQQQARIIIPPLVVQYASQHQLSYRTIKFGNAKKTFGSCHPDSSLRFTWRLMFAPLAFIEYIVVHELAHLKTHNHSKRFWRQVELMLPDYSQQETWLKNNHNLMVFL
jgi:predicted metal-dependent hydrolase